jgi:capsular exopolysaccharide synthesis family protein
VDLRSFAHLIRAHVVLLLGAIAITGATALVASAVLPRTYDAQAQVIVGSPLSGTVADYNQLLTAEQLSRTYALAAQTTSLAGRVIDRLGLDATPDEVLREITAVASDQTPVVVVHAQATTAAAAAALANAVADELVAASATIQGQDQAVRKLIDDQIATVSGQIGVTEQELAALQQIKAPTAADLASQTAVSGQLVTLRSTLASLLATRAGLGTNTVSVLDPAVAPASPSSPKVLVNLVLGLLLGAVLGLVLAAVLTTLDDTMKSGDDVRETLNVPLLGAIGPIPGAAKRDPIYSLAMLLYPRSAAAEAFRALRASIEYLASSEAPIRTLMVVSAGAGEGKTTVASNLAVAFAQAGKRTILVDADLRKPGVHRVFRLGNHAGPLGNNAGLSTVLRPERGEIAPFLQTTEEPRLLVLTAGPMPPSPADLLGSTRMRELLPRLLERADIIVLDSAPIRAAADAAVLAQAVDGVLVVLDTGRTRRSAARSAAEALDRVGARVLGVALNRRRTGRDAAREEMETYKYADEATGSTPGAEGAPG